MAKKLNEKLGKTALLSNDYDNIALCYTDLHNDYEALIYFHKSLTISVNNKENPAIARDYSNIGILYLNTQQTDSAIFYLQNSIVLGSKVSDKGLLLKNYESLANAYAQKGDYKNAFEYHERYSALNDSILNEEKMKTIEEMVAKYNDSQKERMIQLLHKENKTEEARRNALIGGWILLFLLLVGIIYIYIQRQNLSKKNEQIASQRIGDLLKGQEIKTYNAMLDGQEDERQRIASDLHDRLGSMLATVKMHFNVLDDSIKNLGEKNVNQYNRANALLDEACEEVRKISHNLSTGMIMSFGLVPALQELSESVGSTGMMNCKVLVYGLNERLETHIEISIYRMVQELFSNILGHAQAKNVTVQLNRLENILTITVEDDGVGFNVEDKMQSGGMGLKSVSLRIEKLKGNFTIDSAPGKGTIAILELPLNTEEV
jgi:signal transduction histidine kinase